MKTSAIETKFHSVTSSRASLLALCWLLVVPTPACSHFDRTRECHAVAELINPELDGIERLSKSRPTDASALADISQRYARLARRVTELRIQDDELAHVLTEYAGSLTRAAIHTRALAEGLRANNSELVSKERKDLQRLSRKERIQAGQISGLCRS